MQLLGCNFCIHSSFVIELLFLESAFSQCSLASVDFTRNPDDNTQRKMQLRVEICVFYFNIWGWSSLKAENHGGLVKGIQIQRMVI